MKQIVPKLPATGPDSKFLTPGALLMTLSGEAGIVGDDKSVKKITNNVLNQIGNANGSVTIACVGGLKVKFVWGQVSVNANATTNVPFSDVFETQCFNVSVTQMVNDHVNNIMASIVDKNGFSVNVSGGNGTETIMYLAIGI